MYLKDHKLNPYIALFLCTVIELDKYRWTYGRKWRPARMPSSLIKLPVTRDGLPDWEYMENFIKSRPYSKLLKNSLEQSLSDNVSEYDSLFESSSLLAAEPYEIYTRDITGETILLGCYRDKKHLDWILSHNIYNIRLGKRKGSMATEHECFKDVRMLYLYDLKDPSKVLRFCISGSQEMTGSDLKGMDYPRNSPGKIYMTFNIIRDSPSEEYGKEAFNVKEFLDNLPNHQNGIPVFIQP